MSGYRETQKKEWVITAALIVVFVALLTAGAIWLAPQYFALFLLLGAVSISLLVLWHNRTFAYRALMAWIKERLEVPELSRFWMLDESHY